MMSAMVALLLNQSMDQSKPVVSKRQTYTKASSVVPMMTMVPMASVTYTYRSSAGTVTALVSRHQSCCSEQER